MAAMIRIHAAPVFTVLPAGDEGFDVYADGILAAPIQLAANGAIVADQVETNASGIRLSGLRAKDSQAVTFAADDFVSITLPAPTRPTRRSSGNQPYSSNLRYRASTPTNGWRFFQVAPRRFTF